MQNTETATTGNPAPAQACVNPKIEITLTRGRMLALLCAAEAFVCKDTTRFHLGGVLLERVPSGGEYAMLRAVATDGHTLARVDVPTIDFAACGAAATVPDSVLLDGETVHALIRALKCPKRERDTPVTLEIEHTGGKLPSVTCTIGATRVACTLIDAQYPPYEQVIPKSVKEGTHRIGINPAYLARACRAVADFGREADAAHGAVSSGYARSRSPDATYRSPWIACVSDIGEASLQRTHSCRRHPRSLRPK